MAKEKSLRILAENLMPPVLWRGMLQLRRLQRQAESGLFGNYSSFEAAAAAARPYDTDLQLYGSWAEATRRGELEPGLTFFPILAAVLLTERNPARVLDFGGGLGFAYLRLSRVIANRILWWKVVDLPQIVDHGTQHLADGKLTFSPSIEHALADERPDVVICAGVLQYLPAPYELLGRLAAINSEVLVLDRLHIAPRERFMIQKVPQEFGGGIRAYSVLSEAAINDQLQAYNLIGQEVLTEPHASVRNVPDLRYVARLYRQACASTS